MATVLGTFPQASKLYGNRKMSSSENSLFVSKNHRNLSYHWTTNQGLFGRMKNDNPYLDVARQTTFPSWDTMVGTKHSAHSNSDTTLKEKQQCIIKTESAPIISTANKSVEESESKIENGATDMKVKTNLDEMEDKADFKIDLNVTTKLYLKKYQKHCSRFNNRRCSEPVIMNALKDMPCPELHHDVYTSTPKGLNRNNLIPCEKDTKQHSPSHYKGKRRGTYAAVYDPVITARKPKIQNRSKSLFTHADDVTCKDLNTRFLRSIQNLQIIENNNTTSTLERFLARNNDSLENVSSISEDKRTNEIRKMSLTKSNSFTHRSCDSLIEKRKKKKEKRILSMLPSFIHKYTSETIDYVSTDSSGHSVASSPGECHADRNVASYRDDNINTAYTIKPQAEKAVRRTYRALSAVDNISQRHLRNLDRKYDKARKRALLTERRRSIHSGCSDTRSDSSSDLSTNEETLDLHDAVKAGDVEKLQNLINKGYNVNCLDKQGKPPCHYALLNAHFDCLAVLITAGADLQQYFQTRRVKYFR